MDAFETRDTGKSRRLLGFLIPYSIAVLAAALAVRLFGLPSLFRHGAPAEVLLHAGAGVIAGLIVVGSCVLLERYDWFLEMVRWIRIMVDEALGRRVSRSDAALVALSSGLGEEALFRGALQPGLILAFGLLLPEPWSGVLGLLATALIFGLIHAPLVRALWPWTIFAFLMGLLFGGLVLAADSLVPAIVAHVLINYVNLRRLRSVPIPDRGTGAGAHQEPDAEQADDALQTAAE